MTTVRDFFKKWVSMRPDLSTSFHKARIEAMAFAEAYHNELEGNIQIKQFWYDSNPCHGLVKSLEDLKIMMNAQLDENNWINTVDDFLDKSKRVRRKHIAGGFGIANFGTRREHKGDESLRDFLVENGFDCSILIKRDLSAEAEMKRVKMCMKVTDFLIECENPAAFDEAVQQLGGALIDGGVKGNYIKREGFYIMRVFGNTAFLRLAIAKRGYGKVIRELEELI